MRTRKIIDSATRISNFYYYDSNPNAAPDGTWVPEGTQNGHDAWHQCVDVSNPLWFTRGSTTTIVNPCDITHWDWTLTSGQRRADLKSYPNTVQIWTGDTYRICGSEMSGYWPDETLPDMTSNIAAAKLKAIANMDTTPYQFLEDALEIKSTLGMLKNIGNSALNLANAYQKNKQGRLKKLSKTISKYDNSGSYAAAAAKAGADAWMEGRYGWRPIMYSLRNAYESMVNPKRNPPIVLTSRAKIEKNTVSRAVEKTTGATMSRTWYGTFDSEIDGSVGIRYTSSNPIDGFAATYGFRKKDWPRTMYNVMPYSWVVDRFANIGSNISALANLADPSITILGGWQTTFEKSRVSRTHSESSTSAHTISLDPSKINWTRSRLIRSSWQPSAADLYVSFNNPLTDAAFVADLFSLVVQRLKA